jgi:hypothetical protein
MKLLLLLLFPITLLAQTYPRANQIKNTPAGNITSTNVQSAINELDAEKAKKNFTYIVKVANYTFDVTDTVFTNPAFLMRTTGTITFTIPANSTDPFKSGTTVMIKNDSTGTINIEGAALVDIEGLEAGPFVLAPNEHAIVSKENTTNHWNIFIGSSGGGMTNPMTTSGDIIVGGSSGIPGRLALGAATYHLRVNAGGTALEYVPGTGAGITLTAVNHSVPKSDGTNLIESGLASTSAGDLTMGLSGTAGATRTIAAAGSAADVSIALDPKGAGDVKLPVQTVEQTATNVQAVYRMVFPTTNGWGAIRYTSGSTNIFDIGAESQGVYGGTINTLGGSNATWYDVQNSVYRMGIGPTGIWYLGPSLTSFGLAATPTGQIDFGGNATQSGRTRYREDTDNGAHYIELIAPTSIAANVSLTLPSAVPTIDNSVLTSTTGGTMTWRSTTQTTETTTVGNVTTGEDQLFSYTVPASTLSADGNSLHVRFAGTVASNGNTKTLKAKFGATTFATGIVTGSAITTSWTFDCYIIRTGATTQKCNCMLNTPDAEGISYYATAGETLSGTVSLVLTGEGTATNDIVKQIAKVKFEP